MSLILDTNLTAGVIFTSMFLFHKHPQISAGYSYFIFSLKVQLSHCHTCNLVWNKNTTAPFPVSFLVQFTSCWVGNKSNFADLTASHAALYCTFIFLYLLQCFQRAHKETTDNEHYYPRLKLNVIVWITMRSYRQDEKLWYYGERWLLFGHYSSFVPILTQLETSSTHLFFKLCPLSDGSHLWLMHICVTTVTKWFV